MIKRKCPQTLDKPILLFGLELEDIGLLGAVAGLGSLIFGPMIPGLLAILGWILLLPFKKNKPAGYLVHLLYHFGLEIPGLIKPVKKVKYYGIFARTHRLQKKRFC